MNSKYPKFIKLLSESGMIILSVLLALFINEWRNNYNENVQTQKIISNLKAEIKTNQKFVQKLYPYHHEVEKRIDQAIEGDSLNAVFWSDYGFNISKVAPQGIIQGKISDIAWTIAKEDKITNRISLEKSHRLFGVYDQQKVVRSTIDRIINLISSRETQRLELLRENATVFSLDINELVGQLKYLDYQYKKALEVLQD